MEHYYPVGGQYCKLTGKGSLAGIADDILNISKNHRERKDSEATARTMRTVELRDYKRESRARPSKRMTEAMRDIVKYITKNPGAQRAEILKAVFNFSVISPSSLGNNLNYLIDQKIITGNGRTTNRKFYLAGESFD